MPKKQQRAEKQIRLQRVEARLREDVRDFVKIAGEQKGDCQAFQAAPRLDEAERGRKRDGEHRQHD